MIFCTQGEQGGGDSVLRRGFAGKTVSTHLGQAPLGLSHHLLRNTQEQREQCVGRNAGGGRHFWQVLLGSQAPE